MMLVVKNLPDSAGDIQDVDLTPGSGRAPGDGAWQPTGRDSDAGKD